MNQPYVIYTDSAADLPMADIQRYAIGMIPMDYMLNGREICYNSASPQREQLCRELYEAQRHGGEVHTSQITPFRYLEAWRPVLEAGQDVLYLCFSSGLSTTYQNAVAAAEELARTCPERTVRVVDTKAATAGQGLFVCCAGINRDEKHLSLAENAQWLEEHVPQLCHRFTVGDLHYLHRGGRLSATAALLGSLMDIKPCMIIDDEGKLQVTGKASGKKMAIKNLVRSYVRHLGVENVPDMIFITHSGNDEDVEILREQVCKAAPGARVEVMLQSPIIGAHTGPWFLSLCGWGTQRAE